MAGAALGILVIALCAPAVEAQRSGSSAGSQEQPDTIRVWPVRGSVYMVVGAGANITASIGPDGVLLVDTGNEETYEQVLTTLRRVQQQSSLVAGTRSRLPLNTQPPPAPVRYIINTNFRPEHTGANLALATAATEEDQAPVIAHENVLVRLVNEGAPFGMLPTDTYLASEMKLSRFFNGEAVRLIHVPEASTNGDTIVYFRDADVLAAGDVFSMEGFPVIDVDNGGSINGVIRALNQILELAVPAFAAEGGTMVIPGHGRLADATDVAHYRDMLTIIRDQVQSAIEQRMTLEQVQALRPTFGYEARFGSRNGPWTTEMFIEAVYRSLTEPR